MSVQLVESKDIQVPLGDFTKDRTRFQQLLEECVRATGIDLAGKVLIVGGGEDDVRILRDVGFRRLTLSNIQGANATKPSPLDGVELDAVDVDVEDMRIADGSYDLVLAHEVLHHCRSPHRALLEMLRVSRRHLVILEPNDSFLMQLLVKFKFSFPFELPAVIANGYGRGGVRDTCVPNYIYRWNPRDIYQSTASSLAECSFDLHIRRYWDFNVTGDDLALRSQTRIGGLTRILGPDLFLACLRGFQAVVNRLPGLGQQGNKFFACITKHDELKPWLIREGDQIVFNRDYK